MELHIEDLTNLGAGVGRKLLPDGSRWVVMVPLVLPGETVRVRIFRNFASHSDADLVKVIEPSPHRVAPACPYFAQCGGCQYQHIDVAEQRRWKEKQVREVLLRIGGLRQGVDYSMSPVKGSNLTFGYRTKITPHYDVPRGDDPVQIGFQKRGTRQIVDIKSCMIATDRINEVYAELRQRIAAELTTKRPKNGVTLLLREGDGGHVETDFRATIAQTVCGIQFKYRGSDFFQVNADALPLMVQHVVEQARGDGCVNMIDAYCGSGLFSLCAAQYFQRVLGIEISSHAVKAAQQNAAANGIGNAEFIEGTAADIFASVQHVPSGETVVVLDPPRKGCDEAFLQQLFDFAPRKIVYMSCDPATQARDSRSIAAAGYAVADVTPIDLFPHTRHIENCITFMRQ